MTDWKDGTDASFYYHEQASADVASMKSTAGHGNLADAMKDSVTLLPGTRIVMPVVVVAELEDDGQGAKPAARPS